MEAFIALCKSLADSSLPPDVLDLLTSSLSNSSSHLRLTALRALSELHLPALPTDLQVAILVSRHDTDENNRILAEK